MATVSASPAPTSASAPANERSLSRERDAPPNPVCGAPRGTAPNVPTIVGGPVDPPAPGAEPVRPVAPEPPGVAGVTGVTPPAPDAVVPPDPLVPDGEEVAVFVGDKAVKLLTNVVVQVTVLPPPLAEPLH
jgi:hypothetical protein